MHRLAREYNYTHGDCWLFALEMQRYTGWETYQYRADINSSYGWQRHIVCKSPDGRFIDATGWCLYDARVEPWELTPAYAHWVTEWGVQFRETKDYLSFDVETVLFKLGIAYVTPKGHCVLTQLGLKS